MAKTERDHPHRTRRGSMRAITGHPHVAVGFPLLIGGLIALGAITGYVATWVAIVAGAGLLLMALGERFWWTRIASVAVLTICGLGVVGTGIAVPLQIQVPRPGFGNYIAPLVGIPSW